MTPDDGMPPRDAAGPGRRETGDAQSLDDSARRAATTDLGATLLLEAGAGTGKTTVLVERYLQCLRNGAPAPRVVAITFTEKAAGELRLRVRQSLGRESSAEGVPPATADLLGQALAAIDEAPISTIHSFAARLLRERPVEAGIDPAFSQLDAIESDLLTTHLWTEFVTAALGGDGEAAPGAEAVADVLKAGVSLETLRDVVLGGKGLFHQRYDLGARFERPASPDLHADLPELEPPARRLLRHCADLGRDETDAGLKLAVRAASETLKLCDDPPGDLHSLAAQLATLPLWKKDPGGRQGTWGGKQGKEEFFDRYQELRRPWAEARERYETFVAASGLVAAHAFIAFAEREQLRRGVLDFADLLGRLRDLLRDRPDVRRDFQQAFDFLLVDEFQDTDPLQAEIVFLLAEDGEGRTDEELAGDWRDVRLKEGKLFIVGDPKQSIYRFRRADIKLYDLVKGLLQEKCGGEADRHITRNFRTVSPVVDWVNDVFADVIGADEEKGRQPAYVPLLSDRAASGGGPRVTVLYGQDVADEATPEARRIEARACAAFLLEAHESRDGAWDVCVKDGDAEVWRPPLWSDVTVLFRSFTSLEHFEEAFRGAGVPYRVDGGRTYFGRREVADALLALRAVADAADPPAVYGTLHSSLFGFSDEELVAFRAAGGCFDYLADEQPGDRTAIVEALGVLRGLHELRLDAEPHVVLAELLGRTHALEFHAARGEEGRRAIGNLEKLVDRARAFSGAAGGGLGEFVRWAASAVDAGDEAESAGEDPGDVVRIMTIHKAKGLDAHILVVAAGTHKPMADGKVPLIDRSTEPHTAGIFLAAAKPGGVKLPSGETYGFATPGYAARLEQEKAMVASERRRLFYVAATRARDHLVVLNIGKPDANCLLQPWVTTLPEQGSIEADAPQVLEHVVLRRAPEREPLPTDEEPPALEALVARREAWSARREADFAAASLPAGHATPSSLERLDDLHADGPPGDDARSDESGLTASHAGRGDALALGGAVHRALELCRLDDPASVAAAAAVAADEALIPHLGERVADLAAACLLSAPVREAAGVEHWREVPVGLSLGPDGLLQGAVDLVYERGGELVIVDYKTDRDADVGAAERRYALQLGAYALALTQATGRPVAEAWIVMAAGGGPDRPAPAARIPVTGVLLAAAREAAAAAAAADASLVDEV